VTDALVNAVLESWSGRWRSAAFGAATMFWLTSATIYLLLHGISPTVCKDPAYKPIWCHADVQPSIAVTGPLVAVAVVIGSALLANRLAPGVFDILTGGSWLRRRWLWPIAWLGCQWRHWRRNRLNLAVTTPHSNPTVNWLRQVRRHRHEWLLRNRYPRGPVVLPTRIGNSFHSVDQRVHLMYGLDLESTWGPLVAVLPEESRKSLTDQSTVIVLRVQALIFALATPAWALLLLDGHASPVPAGIIWLAVAIVAAVLAVSARGVASASDEYADLALTIVRLHRMRLYDALGFARPTTDTIERVAGQRLTSYLLSQQTGPVEFAWTTRDDPQTDEP